MLADVRQRRDLAVVVEDRDPFTTDSGDVGAPRLDVGDGADLEISVLRLTQSRGVLRSAAPAGSEVKADDDEGWQVEAETGSV